MYTRRSIFTICLALTIALLSLYLLVTLFGYLATATIPFDQLAIFLKPAAFLFLGFSLAAFYVPVFLFVCVYFLLKPPATRKKFTLLNLSLVPFLTLALFLKLVSGSRQPHLIIDAFLSQTMGQLPGSIFVFTLFAFEITLIIRFARRSRQQVGNYGFRSFQQESGRLENSNPANINPEYGDAQSSKRQFVLKLNRLQQERAARQAGLNPPGQQNATTGAGQLRNLKLKKQPPALTAKPAIPPPDTRLLTTETKNTTRRRLFPEPGQQPINKGIGFLQEENRPATALHEPGDTDSKILNEVEYEILVDPGAEETAEQLPVDIILVQDKEPSFSGAQTDSQPEKNWQQVAEPEPLPGEEPAELLPIAELAEPVSSTGTAKKSSLPKNVLEQVTTPRQSFTGYTVPVEGILKDYDDGEYWKIDNQTRQSADVLMDTLKEFKIEAEVTGIRKGPVITMFEILPAPGVKLSKIVNLADNIALRLAAASVRIVAPIPGKHAVGIEVPNKKRAIVSFKELITLDCLKNDKMEIPVIIGKDIAGEAQIIDLVQTPHLLIAGATGSGKSVCVNSIICTILYCRPPEAVKLLLIDPKIVELKFYNDIPHLLTPVITSPKRAFQALQYCLFEMERRYSLLDAVGVRDIKSFNKKIRTKKLTTSPLPYFVILIDEFADLIATAGKEMEATIARLAAMSRAVGIHLVLATQRPSVEVITGLIKANIPSRIAFMVASKFDSRIIIDCVGAEKLLGRGDMLLSTAWDPVAVRIQGTFLSEEEVELLTDHLKTLGEPDYVDEEMFFEDDEDQPDGDYDFGSNDPLMEKALDIVVAQGKASASYLQRKLKIGYNRAARLVEEMEMRGIVGPANGSKPRDLMHIPERHT